MAVGALDSACFGSAVSLVTSASVDRGSVQNGADWLNDDLTAAHSCFVFVAAHGLFHVRLFWAVIVLGGALLFILRRANANVQYMK